MYPLSHARNPLTMNLVNMSGRFNNAIQRMDFGFWEELVAQFRLNPSKDLSRILMA